jgi:hypothetical protein
MRERSIETLSSIRDFPLARNLTFERRAAPRRHPPKGPWAEHGPSGRLDGRVQSDANWKIVEEGAAFALDCDRRTVAESRPSPKENVRELRGTHASGIPTRPIGNAVDEKRSARAGQFLRGPKGMSSEGEKAHSHLPMPGAERTGPTT